LLSSSCQLESTASGTMTRKGPAIRLASIRCAIRAIVCRCKGPESAYLYPSIYLFIHVHIHIYTHTHTHTHAHHTCVATLKPSGEFPVSFHQSDCLPTQGARVSLSIHPSIYIFIHLYIYIYIYIYIYVYTHTHTHIHTIHAWLL